MADQNDDHHLVTGLQAGDRLCQRLLVDRFRNGLHKFIMSHGLSRDDAFDVLNVTFEKAIKHIHSFDLSRGTKFSAWLATIAYRTAQDKLKQLNSRPAVESTEEREAKGLQDTGSLWQEEQTPPSELGLLSNRLLKKALESLSGTDRQILIDRVVNGYEHKQIGAWLDKSEGAVKVAYHRALKKLRQRYLDLLEELEDQDLSKKTRAFLGIEDAKNEKTAN
jgi:RNA polymerase sigma-70 factor, ECF subfamily